MVQANLNTRITADRSRPIRLVDLFKTKNNIGTNFTLLHQNSMAAKISSFDLETDIYFEQFTKSSSELISGMDAFYAIQKEGIVPLDIHHMRAIAQNIEHENYVIRKWKDSHFGIRRPGLKTINFMGTTLVRDVNGNMAPHILSFVTNDGAYGAAADRVKEVLCYEATDEGWGYDDWFIAFREDFVQSKCK